MVLPLCNLCYFSRIFSPETISSQFASESYGRICSLQTGLRLKLEAEPRSLQARTEVAKSVFKSDCSSASKLIHFINSRNRDKVLQSRSLTTSFFPQAPTQGRSMSPGPGSSPEPPEPGAGAGLGPGPMFSTPLRSSLRRRPRTIVGLEEAHTPVKMPTTSRRSNSTTNLMPSSRHSSVHSPATMETMSRTSSSAHLSPCPTSRLSCEPTFRQSPGPSSSVSSGPSASLSPTIIEHEDTQTEQSGGLEGSLRSWREGADPVYEWWRDLLVQTDSECMTYLQSKPIRPHTLLPPTRPVAREARTPPTNLVRIQLILETNKTLQDSISSFTR